MIQRAPAALTAEDQDIWGRFDNGVLHSGPQHRFANALRYFSSHNDARDSLLMLVAQVNPGCFAHYAAYRKHAVLVRGWK
jgi:hypothetical protein